MKIGARICPCFRKEGTSEAFAAFAAHIGLDAVDRPEPTAEIAAARRKNP